MNLYTLNPLKSKLAVAITSAVLLSACSQANTKQADANAKNIDHNSHTQSQGTLINADEKAVVYQVFTRLFGNKNTTNKPWGTIDENGVGKFNDFDDVALESIKALGTTHIWYTGVPHHALINDYTAFGISNDDPDVVKGRAGSPYAVKDYYNVSPDLAVDPAQRLAEFKALVERTHHKDMKVIIDIVPNHIARQYESLSMPAGVENFGSQDDKSKVYSRHNNFYYVIEKNADGTSTPQAFKVPEAKNGYQPLGGDANPLADGLFTEIPAKWTGNGARAAQPDANDWYETVKINYGVRPDGSHDFPSLPAEYASKDHQAHYQFWQNIAAEDKARGEQRIPDSWLKFKDITEYWLAFGIDGFRYDMAEMVPVEFWSYLNSNIKQINPDAFILAEVYNPSLYRDYIHLGKMDYLYDKVDLYDTLKDIIHGKTSTAAIAVDQAKVTDIAPHMLHFLENHDEQRIASPDFAGNPFVALPAMVVSTTISSAPTLLYFGQDVGEKGAENAGFGQPTRTSIFDYVGVPAHQRYMNGGKFDGGQSSEDELALRAYYERLMNLSHTVPALRGEYFELDTHNRAINLASTTISNQMLPVDDAAYNDKSFAFARYNKQQQLVVVSNFSATRANNFTLHLPKALIQAWELADGEYQLNDLLGTSNDAATSSILTVKNQTGSIKLALAPLQSQVLLLSSQ